MGEPAGRRVRAPRGEVGGVLRYGAISLAASCSFVSASAAAQAVTPESLIAPPETDGIEAGPLELFPTILLDTFYDTNIYNREVRKVEDVIFVLRPAIAVQPEMDRHQARLSLAGEIRRHADVTAENTEQFVAVFDTKLEFRGDVDVSSQLLAARRIERRGSLGDQFLTDQPIEYSEVEAGLGVARERSRLRLAAGASINRKTYDDAQLNDLVLDQSARDIRTTRATVRAGYAFSPRLAIFARGAANHLDYRVNDIRNSSGYSLIGGLSLNFGDILEAELGAGYLWQEFDDPAEEKFDGIDYYLTATWRPTARTQVALAGSRSIERSPVPDISAVVESEVRLSGQYALDGFTLVGLEAELLSLDYRGISRTETRYSIGAYARRQVTRNISVVAGAAFDKQTASIQTGRRYEAFSLNLGLRWTV